MLQDTHISLADKNRICRCSLRNGSSYKTLTRVHSDEHSANGHLSPAKVSGLNLSLSQALDGMSQEQDEQEAMSTTPLPAHWITSRYFWTLHSVSTWWKCDGQSVPVVQILPLHLTRVTTCTSLVSRVTFLLLTPSCLASYLIYLIWQVIRPRLNQWGNFMNTTHRTLFFIETGRSTLLE